MSELAFNANGETFDVPANVNGWRVRRMKPRGAPELVYGRDGRPLVIPIDSDMDDLRDAVAAVGKYRLDPVNEDGRTVENVPAAYVHVIKPTTELETTVATSRDVAEDPIREAMRLNTELARAVVDRFPEMMTAAAELLRAADGAGLPSRQARLLEPVDNDGGQDEDEVPETFDVNALVAQLVPLLVTNLASGKLKLPGLAAMLDWRKATPDARGDVSTDSSEVTVTTPPVRASKKSVAPSATQEAEMPPLGASMMAHYLAIQSELTPDEAAMARKVAQDLSADERRAWLDQLSKLSVEDAVAKIRSLVHSKNSGGDS